MITGIWMGTCDSCRTNCAVWPHPDKADNFPGPDDWVEPINCPVCWGDIHWSQIGIGGGAQ